MINQLNINFLLICNLSGGYNLILNTNTWIHIVFTKDNMQFIKSRKSVSEMFSVLFTTFPFTNCKTTIYYSYKT